MEPEKSAGGFVLHEQARDALTETSGVLDVEVPICWKRSVGFAVARMPFVYWRAQEEKQRREGIFLRKDSVLYGPCAAVYAKRCCRYHVLSFINFLSPYAFQLVLE